MGQLWVVWETDSPEKGSVGVEAESKEAAKLAYERAGFKDGTAKLSVLPLVLAPTETKAECLQGLTVEDLAKILRVGHGAFIREADEWRPLAKHVLGLLELERQAALTHEEKANGAVESAATMMRLRSHLWLGHGHTGQYGDDGEMQCAACIPYGLYDYKRSSFEDLFKTLDAVSIHALVLAQGQK